MMIFPHSKHSYGVSSSGLGSTSFIVSSRVPAIRPRHPEYGNKCIREYSIDYYQTTPRKWGSIFNLLTEASIELVSSSLIDCLFGAEFDSGERLTTELCDCSDVNTVRDINNGRRHRPISRRFPEYGAMIGKLLGEEQLRNPEP